MYLSRLKILFVSLILFFSFYLSTYAFDKINAGLLPNIWYSELDIKDGDDIKIIGAFQNQSDQEITITVDMNVGSSTIKQRTLTSLPDSINEISTRWKVVPGSNTISINISEAKFEKPTDTLGLESLIRTMVDDKISIINKIELSEVKEKVFEVAMNTIEKADVLAQNVAEKIEGLKKEEKVVKEITPEIQANIVNTKGNISTDSDESGSVLGAMTEFSSDVAENIKNSSIWTTIYNFLLDILMWLVIHWKIVLFVITVLIILIRFFF